VFGVDGNAGVWLVGVTWLGKVSSGMSVGLGGWVSFCRSGTLRPGSSLRDCCVPGGRSVMTGGGLVRRGKKARIGMTRQTWWKWIGLSARTGMANMRDGESLRVGWIEWFGPGRSVAPGRGVAACQPQYPRHRAIKVSAITIPMSFRGLGGCHRSVGSAAQCRSVIASWSPWAYRAWVR
jgi:hypothetical protein